MNSDTNPTKRRVAVLFPGEPTRRALAGTVPARFQPVFDALRAVGIAAEAAAYHDDLRDEVRRRLQGVDGVLVWVNPIEGDRDRSVLDAMLRELAASGVFVSALPDIILKIGTKDVLYTTRNVGWGCDTTVHRSLRELRDSLPGALALGPRVLKQYRGQSGNGVWKVASAGEGLVRARHAKRGSLEEILSMEAFLERCATYFAGEGRLVDQEWQSRIAEGMVRCYLVQDVVAGFGHQAINALHPDVLEPGPRLYHPPTMPAFQALRIQLEREWVPAMGDLLGIAVDELPVLWDCDFILGPKEPANRERYVLCEINASSVHPFPESALEPLARATLERIVHRRRQVRT